jgi:hypothetical protein
MFDIRRTVRETIAIALTALILIGFGILCMAMIGGTYYLIS